MKAAHAVWCEACERRCYAATAGGRWQLSWRVGRGMPHVRYFEPELAECKVLAKQPPSALPGSFLRLDEVIGDHVRVWMHCDATALAARLVAARSDAALERMRIVGAKKVRRGLVARPVAEAAGNTRWLRLRSGNAR